jgi:hypothetical protein
MITNILQFAAGILLAISSFVVNDTFQVPVFGKKLPGTYEKAKQMWIVRIGLILFAGGYALPIIGWDITLSIDMLKSLKFIIGFYSTLILVVLGYFLADLLAKNDYKNAPVFDKNSPVQSGMFALDFGDAGQEEEKKDQF